VYELVKIDEELGVEFQVLINNISTNEQKKGKRRMRPSKPQCH
jgi:hypothetical protein